MLHEHVYVNVVSACDSLADVVVEGFWTSRREAVSRDSVGRNVLMLEMRSLTD